MPDSCVHSIEGEIEVRRLNRYFGLAKKALDFVAPYENICCRLYEMIELNPQDVCAILDSGGNIHGVFSFTRGQLVLPCIPFDDEKIRYVLQSFFYNNRVFCLSGKKEFCHIVKSSIEATATQVSDEERSYTFFECKMPPAIADIPGLSFVHCVKNDGEALIGLQLEYIKEEVLPKNMDLNPPAERLVLDRLLKKGVVFALKSNDGSICAKAQINASSPNYNLIGGVYTAPQHRGKGYASLLPTKPILPPKACTVPWVLRKSAIIRFLTSINESLCPGKRP